MSREEALAYLEAHNVMTLATYGTEGAWAAAVFYASDGFDCIFLSAPTSRHARHIQTNEQIAAAVHEDYPGWENIKGIQMSGMAVRLSGQERSRGETLYRQKFTFLDSAPDEIQTALDRIAWYRLRPERLYFVDNSRGFGFRQEIL